MAVLVCAPDHIALTFSQNFLGTRSLPGGGRTRIPALPRSEIREIYRRGRSKTVYRVMDCDIWKVWYTFLLPVLGVMHVAFDAGFASDALQTHIACKESCSVSVNVSDASKNYTQKMLCSDGNTCPENPNLYFNLFVATMLFTSWHVTYAFYFISKVLRADSGYYSGNQTVSEAFEKKQFRVLLNGNVTLEIFRMYRGRLVWSTEATLEHFEKFDERVQFLKKIRVLFPVYWFIRFLHFTVIAINSAKCAKIFFPNEMRNDQQSVTPKIQVMYNSEGNIATAPAIVLAQPPRDARDKHILLAGIWFKSLPQAIIQMIYLRSVLFKFARNPILSLLANLIHVVIIELRAIINWYIDSDEDERNCVNHLLHEFINNKGHSEDELSIVPESIKVGNAVAPAEGP